MDFVISIVPIAFSMLPTLKHILDHSNSIQASFLYHPRSQILVIDSLHQILIQTGKLGPLVILTSYILYCYQGLLW